ncbi:hypothetical protein OS175_12555 [Marinicella sp. S1101]|uniref:hypothetical protein n=1 Tax=Marinicella marina TaxID=2996016 RepID=UPI002260BF45|nr:hypothetical protein [Marinicella marina]MCX7554713.1 hypothetical protein [Marinicella marina]MDJ1141471.1 hypothetical protein [Marinicella marina]
MNTKLIHSIIFALLLALTAHEAHSAVSHDVEACEVCIHVQSNDDAVPASAATYLSMETAIAIKCSGNFNAFIKPTTQHTDLIRGPPQHS